MMRTIPALILIGLAFVDQGLIAHLGHIGGAEVLIATFSPATAIEFVAMMTIRVLTVLVLPIAIIAAGTGLLPARSSTPKSAPARAASSACSPCTSR